jgi:hypothetical protein
MTVTTAELIRSGAQEEKRQMSGKYEDDVQRRQFQALRQAAFENNKARELL